MEFNNNNDDELHAYYSSYCACTFLNGVRRSYATILLLQDFSFPFHRRIGYGRLEHMDAVAILYDFVGGMPFDCYKSSVVRDNRMCASKPHCIRSEILVELKYHNMIYLRNTQQRCLCSNLISVLVMLCVVRNRITFSRPEKRVEIQGSPQIYLFRYSPWNCFAQMVLFQVLDVGGSPFRLFEYLSVVLITSILLIIGTARQLLSNMYMYCYTLFKRFQ